jgi:RNA polymerase sigma-70 factor (ECF subfamily)
VRAGNDRWRASTPRDPGDLALTALPQRPDFTQTYDAWFGYVWRMLRRLGVREAELADATQEVFITVHRRLPDFDPTLPVGPWIAGITYKTASHERRRARHHREQLTEDELLTSVRHGGPDPERAAVTAQRAARVYEALEALDLDQRVVFIMHEMDGTPCPEIADALSVPLNTVYSRLRLARGKFETVIARHRRAEEAA